MKKLKAHIRSFRLRTLPLSVAGIILGMFLALGEGIFRPLTFILAIATTLSLQILCNMANELGDTLSGTDTDERVGPQYSLQEGGLTTDELRRDIIAFVIISCLVGTGMIWSAFDLLWSQNGLIMIAVGAVTILAALGYTLGSHPYGYMGFGDIMVLIFFGLMSTGGCYFLMTGSLPGVVLLPATACGLLSVGVLNINNIRDIKTDSVNRITIPIIIGVHRAKIYHAILIGGAFVLSAIYCIAVESPWYSWLYLLLLPPFAAHVKAVFASQGRELDRTLPQLSILTLLFCLVFGVLQAL